MDSAFHIYGLFDPSGELRYIGQTTSISKRYHKHLNCFKNSTHKENWIKSLLREGLKPSIKIIQTVHSFKDCNDAEQYWISYFKEKGANLTNSALGGQTGGMTKGYKMSEKSINNIRAAAKKRWENPEYRKKISEAFSKRQKGKKLTGYALEVAKETLKKNNTDPKLRAKRKLACKKAGEKRQKKIIDSNGKIYNSLTQAAIICFGRKDYTSNISKVCKGKIKSLGGISFKYLETN